MIRCPDCIKKHEKYLQVLDRARRAEAEVLALCGKPEALDPWLPSEWVRQGQVSWCHKSSNAIVWIDHSQIMWEINSDTGGEDRGLLSAMAAVEKALQKASQSIAI